MSFIIKEIGETRDRHKANRQKSQVCIRGRLPRERERSNSGLDLSLNTSDAGDELAFFYFLLHLLRFKQIVMILPPAVPSVLIINTYVPHTHS